MIRPTRECGVHDITRCVGTPVEQGGPRHPIWRGFPRGLSTGRGGGAHRDPQAASMIVVMSTTWCLSRRGDATQLNGFLQGAKRTEWKLDCTVCVCCAGETFRQDYKQKPHSCSGGRMEYNKIGKEYAILLK